MKRFYLIAFVIFIAVSKKVLSMEAPSPQGEQKSEQAATNMEGVTQQAEQKIEQKSLTLSNAQCAALKRCRFFVEGNTITSELISTPEKEQCLILLAALIDNPLCVHTLSDEDRAKVYLPALFIGAPTEVVAPLAALYFTFRKSSKEHLVDKIPQIISLLPRPFRYGTPMNWADTISADCIQASLRKWKERYKKVKPDWQATDVPEHLLEEMFTKALKEGTYKLVPSESFSQKFVKSNRIVKFLQLVTSLETEDIATKEVKKRDIAKLYSLLGTTHALSPVLIVKTTTNPKHPLIKIDGSHRIAAAIARKSPVRVLFVTL